MNLTEMVEAEQNKRPVLATCCGQSDFYCYEEGYTIADDIVRCRHCQRVLT